jgi:hypothetical protein
MNGQKIDAPAHAARPTMTNTQVSIDFPDVTRRDVLVNPPLPAIAS